MSRKTNNSECGDCGVTITKTYRKWWSEEWIKTCMHLKKFRGLDKIKITCEENDNDRCFK